MRLIELLKNYNPEKSVGEFLHDLNKREEETKLKEEKDFEIDDLIIYAIFGLIICYSLSILIATIYAV